MVRREEDRPQRETGEGEVCASSCVSPAGESPAPVSAGAPASRPPTSLGETLEVEAGRQKPLRREQQRGPQHEVKPAASTELPRGSRAAHVTAKATSGARRSGAVRAAGSPGVGGAARVEGETRNTRGPSARPLSGQDGPYKPKAKSGVVQRESEG